VERLSRKPAEQGPGGPEVGVLVEWRSGVGLEGLPSGVLACGAGARWSRDLVGLRSWSIVGPRGREPDGVQQLLRGLRGVGLVGWLFF
jgi:hypothetical protein